MPQPENARATAIASMAYRLAAAGPRTRQRLIEREDTDAGLHREPAPLRAPPITAGAWSSAPIREPMLGLEHAPLRTAPATRHLVAALGVVAACGFGLVLLVQHPEGLSPSRLTPVKLAQQTLPAIGQPPAEQPRIAALPSQPDAPSDLPAASLPDADINHAVQSLAGTIPEAPQRVSQTRQPFRPSKPENTPAPTSQRPHVASRVMQAVARPPDPKPRAAYPMLAAKYALPHWLTEDHPAPSHALVMSEPPHNLVAPESVADHAAVAPVAARPPQPQAVLYAVPAIQNRVALRPPGYRPTYPQQFGAYYPPTPRTTYAQAPTSGW